MEKVRPWCGQPSDRGRLRNRTEHFNRYQSRTAGIKRVTPLPSGVWRCLRKGEAKPLVLISALCSPQWLDTVKTSACGTSPQNTKNYCRLYMSAPYKNL